MRSSIPTQQANRRGSSWKAAPIWAGDRCSTRCGGSATNSTTTVGSQSPSRGGCDALVGALLCEPSDSSCVAGVIFFNNVGFLGMCCHGTIGVVVTLAYLKRIDTGSCRLETPVGVVEARLLEPNRVAVTNVASYRYQARVRVPTQTLGVVVGDVAWGGNWFFLVDNPPLALTGNNLRNLSNAAEEVRCELRRHQITGPHGEEIDHVEFFGKPESPNADSRNFVSCPGGAYDRSPCGTGTSTNLPAWLPMESCLPRNHGFRRALSEVASRQATSPDQATRSFRRSSETPTSAVKPDSSNNREIRIAAESK